MTTNSLENRANALEEEFFYKKNKEALDRLVRGVLKNKTYYSPINGKELSHNVIKGVNVYVCEDSKGIWIPKAELETLFANLKNDNQGIQVDLEFFKDIAEHARKEKHHGNLKVSEEVEGLRLSPDTRENMEKIEISNLVLDRCKTSEGIWFDAGELDKFIDSANHVQADLSSWVDNFFRAIGYK